MPPSFQPASLNLSGTMSVITVLDSGAPPSTMIQGVNTAFDLQVDWSITGNAVPLIAGEFLVRAAIEGYGVAAPELDLGPIVVNVTGVPLVGTTRNYTTIINVPNGLPEGAYSVIVLVTYLTPAGTPGPIAALSEPTVIQVFP
jgi:hypothetical protein